MYSPKSAFIHALAETIESSSGKDIDYSSNQLVLLTATGTIVGTPVKSLPKIIDRDALLMASFNRAAVEEGTDILFLTNAHVSRKDGSKEFFSFLYLFPDDVIAVSLGKSSN